MTFDPLAAATDAGFRAGSDEWLKEVKRLRQEHARDIGHEEVAKRYRKIWEEAGPADPLHPYLVRKGIISAPKLRQRGNLLLVPMFGLEKGAPLMSIQFIWPDGSKKYGKGARARKTRTTLGAEAYKKGGTLYITEGWATGWTVWYLTGEAVVVAFSVDNLLDVTEAMRVKYPEAHIIIAADNDWPKTASNPGLVGAWKAADAARSLPGPGLVEVCVPDFQDRSTKPTDFNDLYLLEGADAARYWLEPDRADEAVTVPPEEPMEALWAPSGNGQAPEEEPPTPARPEGRTWLERAPFRCIGHERGTFFYLPESGGQVTPLTPRGHDRASLSMLAPLSWWIEEFPMGKSADWAVATDALIQASMKMGVYRPHRLRGRGCWWEEDAQGDRALVLHLGDRLLAGTSKEYIAPESYDSPEGRIYERLERLDGPSPKRAMPVEEARRVLALCEDLLWQDDASGAILAGWIALAPICGALPWRPHIWLIGPSGAGKTAVLEQLIQPLLGGMECFYGVGTTEAGIRQEVQSDAVPVLYDEAEREDSKSDSTLHGLLRLLRGASNTEGGVTAKGTISGVSMSFKIRSMFCLASIGGAVKGEADKSRITLLQLRGKKQVDETERIAHWKAYQPRLSELTPMVGREMMSRMLRLVRNGTLARTLAVFRAEATTVLGNSRSGDQYGVLYAGVWSLMSDEAPTAAEATELLSTYGLGVYVAEQVPESERVLRTILQAEVRVDTIHGAKSYAVGQLVDLCVKHGDQEAQTWLGAHGIVPTADSLILAMGSEWIAGALRDTPYRDGWHNQLRALPGVTQGPLQRFHAGLKSRTIIIPRAALEGDGEEEEGVGAPA